MDTITYHLPLPSVEKAKYNFIFNLLSDQVVQLHGCQALAAFMCDMDARYTVSNC